jgi:hypothetical protein
VKIKSGCVGDCSGGWRQARGHLPAVWRERRRAKVGESIVANDIAHTSNYVSLRKRMTFCGLTELVCSRK